MFSGLPAVMSSSDLVFLGLPSRNGFGFAPSWLAHVEGPVHPHFTCTFSVWGHYSCYDDEHKVRGLKRQDWIPSWPGGQKCAVKVWAGLPPSGGSEGVPSRLPPDAAEGQRSPRLVAASLPSLPVLTSPSPVSSLRTLATD